MKLPSADAIFILDVDNVLLALRVARMPDCYLARHASEFISLFHVLGSFRVVRWPSTHCTRGGLRAQSVGSKGLGQMLRCTARQH